ncbi:MAG TPA: hypothetical protein VFP32_02785 [Candidatus Saccharimonadales bacterium]|nr:hypothetical protein [Candidatus Saccharimonadales bacterium]
MAGEHAPRQQAPPEELKRIMIALGEYVAQHTVQHFEGGGTLILRNESVAAAYEALDFDETTADERVSDEVIDILMQGAINPNLN